jgi:ubiquinone/menaquinone biosynthesis C-methylase UbiE
MNADSEIDNWNSSYARRENFVFCASDGAVRFVSRHLRKRVAPDLVVDVAPGAKGSRMLDVGCGIGRHIQFGVSMGLDMYGIELSTVAVDVARKWAHKLMEGAEEKKIVAGDIRAMPWPDGYFDHALSDSVLDSMSFEIAQKGVEELARVLKPGGFFYCNLIAERSADGSIFAGERKQLTLHEQGTIQSYFDEAKIDALFGGRFETLQRELHTIDNLDTGASSGRWHMTMRRV